jgi:hypothetical protein
LRLSHDGRTFDVLKNLRETLRACQVAFISARREAARLLSLVFQTIRIGQRRFDNAQGELPAFGNPPDLTTDETRALQQEKRAVYDNYRRRCVDEDRLIADRMFWFMLIEAMFFTALTLTKQDGPVTKARLITTIVVVLFGWIVAYISCRSVKAARDEIEYLQRTYERHPLFDAQQLSLIGALRHHNIGHWLPMLAPMMVSFLWLIVAGDIISKYRG